MSSVDGRRPLSVSIVLLLLSRPVILFAVRCVFAGCEIEHEDFTRCQEDQDFGGRGSLLQPVVNVRIKNV